LYLLNGKPVFTYNFIDPARFHWRAPDALAPGKHTIVFDFTYDGPGIAKGGTGVLKVNGKEVANLKIPHTIGFGLPVAETFDIGTDTRTGVDDQDYGSGASADNSPVVSRNSNEAIGECASRLLDDPRRLVSPYTPLQCPHRFSLFSCCS
jgi:hypothetical protein